MPSVAARTPWRAGRTSTAWGFVAFGFGIALVAVLGDDYAKTLLTFAGVNALAAIGLNLLVGYTGQVSFGQNAFVGLGAYAAAYLAVSRGLEPIVAVLVALVLASVIALLLGFPTLRVRGHYLALATLAVGVASYTLLFELEGITGGAAGIGGIPPLSLGVFTPETTSDYFVLTWGAVLVAQLLVSRLVHSPYGRVLMAIRDDELAARGVGVNARAVKVQMFVLAGVLGAAAGSILAFWTTYISPESFSVLVAIELIIVLYVGGLGRLWGPIIGAVALGLLLEATKSYTADWSGAIYGILLMLVLVAAPFGLTGLITRGAAWARERRS